MTDYDRIYDLLQRQGETLARIDQSQADTKERLFGSNGQPGAIQFLHGEIGKTNEAVGKQGRQIQFWRGALSVITFVFTGLLSWVGIVIRHR